MPSLQARLVHALLRASGVKQRFGRPRYFMQRAIANEPRGHARPPARLLARLDVETSTVHGCPVLVARPREGARGGHIVYLHGGAYAFHLLPAHWNIVEQLIAHTGAAVTLPIYPVAPRHGWREAHAMVRAAYAEVAAAHGTARLALMGDSAGGGLALALAQAVRDAGEPMPACLALFSPWLDITLADPRQRMLDRRDPMLSFASARAAGLSFARELEPDDPRVSPLYGALHGLPPIAVFSGTRDILNADAHRLLHRAHAHGAEVTLFEYPEMVHVWMAVRWMPEAREAMHAAARFLRAHGI